MNKIARKSNKLLFLIFISVIHLKANNLCYEKTFKCITDPVIMYSIAEIEHHVSRNIGYPYLISFNNKTIAQKAIHDKYLSNLFIDNRTLDCMNKQKCKKTLQYIRNKYTNNLDCGGFQINDKSWGFNSDIYFSIQKSYQCACKMVQKHNKNEWSFENIAKYHSKTKSVNKKYREKLKQTIKKNIDI